MSFSIYFIYAGEYLLRTSPNDRNSPQLALVELLQHRRHQCLGACQQRDRRRGDVYVLHGVHCLAGLNVQM
jgi:hypothetical protein